MTGTMARRRKPVAVTNYKILFTGPVGAGKTTAIASLSDQPPVSTDTIATDGTRHRKPRTTVAMDYGVMRLSVEDQLHLYGTPGQERFDFMWEILQEGALGLVIMIDNAAPAPIDDLTGFVEAYRPLIEQTALAVGITRTDIRAVPTFEHYVEHLAGLGVHGPVFTVDARQRSDVARLVEALLFSLDPGLDVDGTRAEVGVR
jgi:signal recognition particle receptor subunit beta